MDFTSNKIIGSSYEKVGFFHCISNSLDTFYLSKIVDEKRANIYLGSYGPILPEGYSLLAEFEPFIFNKKSHPGLNDLIIIISDEGKYGVFSVTEKVFITNRLFDEFDKSAYEHGFLLLKDNEKWFTLNNSTREVNDFKYDRLEEHFMLNPDSTYIGSIMVFYSDTTDIMKFTNNELRLHTKMDSILFKPVDFDIRPSIKKLNNHVINTKFIDVNLHQTLNSEESNNLFNLTSLYAGMKSERREGIDIILANDSVSFVDYFRDKNLFTVDIDKIELFKRNRMQVKLRKGNLYGALDFLPIEKGRYVPVKYDRISISKCIDIGNNICVQIYMVTSQGKSYYVDSYGKEYKE